MMDRSTQMGLIVIAAFVGALLPVQAGVNAQLRGVIGHPVPAAFLSLLIALATVTILLLATAPAVRWPRGPWWMWSGGILGAAYLLATILLARRMGAAALISSLIAGQVSASLLLDHYGVLGFAQRSITWPRLAGGALIFAGVLLTRRS